MPLDDLRRVRIQHAGFDEQVHQGDLVVAVEVAEDVLEIFAELLDVRFPIGSVRPIHDFGCSDARSMEANNTSAFNCRKTTSGSRWSEHAHGTAIDINPVQNPYVQGQVVEPPEGRPYVDRRNDRRGMVLPDGPVVNAFETREWTWGGSWRSLKDYQHFSLNGR